jgi:protein gp37
MGADTSIQWCDHTFNPWWGCTKVSSGCNNCYAETFARRTGRAKWGDDEPRVVVSDATWHNPVKWDRAAAKAGERRRVFCGSMCDVFEDREDLVNSRVRLFELIHRTPSLDWLLLTKRPEAASVWLEGSLLQGLWPLDNVWLGTSIENQATADDRIPHLLPIMAKMRFLSMEPLLDQVYVQPWLGGIDWVIVGGESGPKARPFDLAWARSIRNQCKYAGVPFFMKQVGAKPGGMNHPLGFPPSFVSWRPADSHGADPAEWPADLRIREFPR